MPQLPITVAIPVRNEEKNLARCLQKLDRFADVVVIDSDSTDNTADIAREHNVRLLKFSWNGRYPKKRNWFLINHTPKQPWVLFLDADELVNKKFCEALTKAVSDPKYDAYWLNYTNHFLGQSLRFGLAQRKLALFRVGRGLYERVDENEWSRLDMEIHEHPLIEGVVGEIRTPIDHRDYKGLGKFIERHREYALWEARRYVCLQSDPAAWSILTRRQKFKYRNMAKWWYPLFYFLFVYFIKLGFLDRGVGFNYSFFKTWYFNLIRLIIIENKQK